MNVLKTEKPYPVVNGKNIKEFKIKPLMFMGLVGLAKKVDGSENTDTALGRLRMLKQIVAMDTEGGEHKLDDLTLTTLPANYGRKLYNLITYVDDEPGGIILKGDGFTTPIVYRLSSPIKSADETEIPELEFMGKTYGDIEPVIAESAPLEQTRLLIETCASPIVTGDKTLFALPSWAADQISMADGLKIMYEVLPDFLA